MFFRFSNIEPVPLANPDSVLLTLLTPASRFAVSAPKLTTVFVSLFAIIAAEEMLA